MQNTNCDIARIWVLIVLMIVMSLACQTKIDAVLNAAGEEFNQYCIEVDRSTYEEAMIGGGKEPEDPKYPESAVYEICYNQDEFVTDIRLSDGYPANEDVDFTHAGKYLGTIDYPPAWQGYLKGDSTTNSVTIEIREDGTVDGSFSIIFVGPEETFEYGDVTCSGYAEREFFGSLAGQISDSEGQVEVTEKWDCRLFYDCNQMTTTCFDDRVYDFKLKISGDELEGTPLLPGADPGTIWSFTAQKE